MTGQGFSSQKAQSMGLITEVVEPENLDATVEKYVRRFLVAGPKAMVEAKRLVREVTLREREDALGFAVSKIAELKIIGRGSRRTCCFPRETKAELAVMKVLIANRGEIACRVAATLRKRNIPSVAIYSDVDAGARHVLMCDEAVGIGEPKAYLDIDKVLAAAKQVSATAIHPGYGFLAENATFSQRCSEEGIRFIGPSPEAIDAFGDKGKARRLAVDNDVPVIPGAESCSDAAEAQKLADEIGFPVLLKLLLAVVVKECGKYQSLAKLRRHLNPPLAKPPRLLGVVICFWRNISIRLGTLRFRFSAMAKTSRLWVIENALCSAAIKRSSKKHPPRRSALRRGMLFIRHRDDF